MQINDSRIGPVFSTEERPYAYWLCSFPWMSGRNVERLFPYFQSPVEIWTASQKQLEQVLTPGMTEMLLKSRSSCNIEKLYEQLLHDEIHFCLRQDMDFPSKLLDIPDSPLGLFYIGKLPDPGKLSVSIIGARECSAYGLSVAKSLGQYLGQMQVQVISGMARGIDGVSQLAALDAGGKSYAVLGSGPDICYPPSNRGLYQRLCQEGGVLSTYAPGTPAKAGHFPPRNRIVSGLSDAVVVIEARQKSGTLITVDMALEQGREVYAVPGRITDRLSDGCNGLLGQGAQVFLSPELFLSEISAQFFGNTQASNQKTDLRRHFSGDCKVPTMSPELVPVYQALDYHPQSIEEILGKIGGSDYVQVNLYLMQLTLNGLAIQISQGYYCRS